MKVIANSTAPAGFVEGQSYDADNFSGGTSMIYDAFGRTHHCQTVTMLEQFTPAKPAIKLSLVAV